MTIDSLLKKPWKEKIFLAEIDAVGGTIYLSDRDYKTESVDTPASQLYYPIIKGVPRLSRRIQELRGGRSQPSYGELKLAWYMAGPVNLHTAGLRGRQVRLYITGPRDEVTRAAAVRIMTGVVLRCSGTGDGELSLHLGDLKAAFGQVTLPPNRYAIATMPDIPVALDGQPIPLCLNKCLNITPVLINAATQQYQVHDGAISALDVVYDNGVVVPSANYTVNLTSGTFTFAAGHAPWGAVTADVRGGVYDDYGASMTSLLQYLACEHGGMVSTDVLTSGFPGFGHWSGIYIAEQTTLEEVFTRLCQGCFAWWGFTRSGQLLARVFAPPVTASVTLDDVITFGPCPWEEYPDIVWSQPLIHSRNWTMIGSPAGAVTADYRSWLASEGNLLPVQDSAILTSYPTAIEAEPLYSYIHNATYADDAGAAVLALLGTKRRQLKVKTLQSDPPIELGGTVAVTSTDTAHEVMNDLYLVLGITDQWDDEVPLVELELFG